MAVICVSDKLPWREMLPLLFFIASPSNFTLSYFVMSHCLSFQQIYFPPWGRRQSLSISQVMPDIKSFFPGFTLCVCLPFSTSEPQIWSTALFLCSVPMARARSGDQSICKSAQTRQIVVEREGRGDEKAPEGAQCASNPLCPPSDVSMAFMT